jgi:hypothetical protein
VCTTFCAKKKEKKKKDVLYSQRGVTHADTNGVVDALHISGVEHVTRVQPDRAEEPACPDFAGEAVTIFFFFWFGATLHHTALRVLMVRAHCWCTPLSPILLIEIMPVVRTGFEQRRGQRVAAT